MNKGAVPLADQHACFSGHGGVYGVLGQPQAIDVILRRRRHASDAVARIDIFQVHLDPSFLEKFRNLVLQKLTDIPEPGVAGSVRFRRALIH